MYLPERCMKVAEGADVLVTPFRSLAAFQRRDDVAFAENRFAFLPSLRPNSGSRSDGAKPTGVAVMAAPRGISRGSGSCRDRARQREGSSSQALELARRIGEHALAIDLVLKRRLKYARARLS